MKINFISKLGEKTSADCRTIYFAIHSLSEINQRSSCRQGTACLQAHAK